MSRWRWQVCSCLVSTVLCGAGVASLDKSSRKFGRESSFPAIFPALLDNCRTEDRTRWMSRRNSPYIYRDYWLDKRRGGDSPFWQITWNDKGKVVYRSTGTKDLSTAKAAIEAFEAEQRPEVRREAHDSQIAHILSAYWREKGGRSINSDQTQRSLYTFMAFLEQDTVGLGAAVTSLTPHLIERFREWRMGQHGFSFEWGGINRTYASEGVAGSTVQRNINDIRAAVYHAESNMRITKVPRIRGLDSRYRSVHRDRILTEDELARIVWFAAHNKALFRFVALQVATGVRPMAALQFDPRTQYDDLRGMIDLQPQEGPLTKKRNAIIPAIRPMRVVLRAWAKEGTIPVASHKTAWRNMRRVLELDDDVKPKTIRYTIATWLYEMPEIPPRQISEMLGHTDDSSSGLARTSRIYAKYRPERMGKVLKGLTDIWRQVSRDARTFGTVHILSSGQRGHPYEVVRK